MTAIDAAPTATPTPTADPAPTTSAAPAATPTFRELGVSDATASALEARG